MRLGSTARGKRLGGSALAAAFGLVLAGSVFSVAVPSCGTDAIGVEACRQIENARCQASLACGFSTDDVTNCELFYHDQCLHGLENATVEPDQPTVDLCVSTIRALGVCAQNGLTMADCANVAVTSSADAEAVDLETACQVLQHEPENVQNCSFVVAPADAGTGGAGGGSLTDVFIL